MSPPAAQGAATIGREGGSRIKSAKRVSSKLLFPMPAAIDALDTVLSLPGYLHPTDYRLTGATGPRAPIEDPAVFRNWRMRKSGLGFSLFAARATYRVNFWISHHHFPAEIESGRIPVRWAHDYLTHMAGAGPTFGYCCLEEEFDHRHYLTTKFPSGTMSGYQGRDAARYVPGLYWLTLVSEGLLDRHRVSLATLAGAALAHTDLGGGLHLLRFYERPDDWSNSVVVDRILDTTSGIFNLRKVVAELTPTTDMEEMSDQLWPWR
jgi:hypothetical protein